MNIPAYSIGTEHEKKNIQNLQISYAINLPINIWFVIELNIQ